MSHSALDPKKTFFSPWGFEDGSFCKIAMQNDLVILKIQTFFSKLFLMLKESSSVILQSAKLKVNSDELRKRAKWKLPFWHISPEDGVNMLHLSQGSISDCQQQTESHNNEHNGGGKGKGKGAGEKLFKKSERSSSEFRA